VGGPARPVIAERGTGCSPGTAGEAGYCHRGWRVMTLRGSGMGAGSGSSNHLTRSLVVHAAGCALVRLACIRAAWRCCSSRRAVRSRSRSRDPAPLGARSSQLRSHRTKAYPVAGLLRMAPRSIVMNWSPSSHSPSMESGADLGTLKSLARHGSRAVATSACDSSSDSP
jgi:hypothetical protein